MIAYLGGDLETSSENFESLSFEVSAGLKRIIGRDLITDDEVAIFELVKNSFDAGASKVQLFFDKDKIAIVDDGHGMAKEDIINKWLLVAYSSKKQRSSHDDQNKSYRDQIESKRNFAGSKGIGRFSSDRLGHKLRLQSSPKGNLSDVHVVNVDWDHFEKDERQNFINVHVEYSHSTSFDLPSQVRVPKHGTAVEITGLRKYWDRNELIRLRASLAKLINPFGLEIDAFALEVIAPLEKGDDLEVKEDFESWTEEKQEGWGFPYYKVVNGPVKNFIFETLEEKTTFIDVSLIENDTLIETILSDRGEEVYRIREPNPYSHLVDSGFDFRLFYLNSSAKMTFARRMGVRSVEFGSVFLFRNGIRVYPFGERGDDSLGMDVRKQQGQRRFLGSRDLIGRINVSGDEERFNEATSRNAGLVDTPAYLELKDCFWEKCLKRLEKYVVGVSWPDAGEATATDLSRLLNDQGRSRVVEVIASLAKAKSIQLVSYSENLVQILDEKADEFEGSLRSIKAVAEKTKDTALLEKLSKAKKRFQELQQAEAEARSQAAKALKNEEFAKQELALEQEKNLYLLSTRRSLSDDAEGLIHTVKVSSTRINIKIESIMDKVVHDELSKDELLSELGSVKLNAMKILKMTELATRAGFDRDIEKRSVDIAKFIGEYIELYHSKLGNNDINFDFVYPETSFVRSISVLNLGIVIDNLISNAVKWGATSMKYEFHCLDGSGEMEMLVSDNGSGLAKELMDHSGKIFELGVKATPPNDTFPGSGIGLYHAKDLLKKMNADISFVGNDSKLGGAVFKVVFKK